MPTADELKKAPRRDALEQLLREIAPGGQIASVRRLPGGISCGMHAINVIETSGTQLRLVVRRYNDDSVKELGTDIAEREFKTLAILKRAGVPAPDPIWYEAEANLFDAPTVVESRLPGKATLSPSNFEIWIKRLAEGLALLHAVDLNTFDSTFLRNEPTATIDYINGESIERRCSKHPLGERALASLRERLPSMSSNALLHTDYWPGNTVWSRGKLSGIVDWEWPAIGEPASDVAYCRQDLAFSFSQDAADLFLSFYKDATGEKLQNIGFWDIRAGIRAMPDVALWLPGYTDLGRTDLTAELMRERHSQFIQQAIASPN